MLQPTTGAKTIGHAQQATKSSSPEQDAELLRILSEVESKYGIGNAVANAVENEV